MVLVGQLLVGDVREMRGGILRVEVGVGGGGELVHGQESIRNGVRVKVYFSHGL